MPVTNSPNMSLPVPTTGVEPGPNYANDVNTSLNIIDGHDHSSGSGVPITPAGININTDLPLNNNALTSVKGVTFASQNSSAILQQLYVKAGTESPSPINDLWFNDGAGNAIQITQGGAVNATIASIPGESYAFGTFTWRQGTGSTIPANFDIGSITIRPNVAATTNGVTLSPPSAIASAYTINLPALPGAASFLQIDNTGVMSASIPVSGGIQGSNIASATITGTNIAQNTITGGATGNIALSTIVDGNITPGTITTTSIAAATILGSNIATGTVTPNNLTAVSTVTASPISGSLNNSTATCSVSGYATSGTTNRVTSWNFSGYLTIPATNTAGATITITIHQGISTTAINTVVVPATGSGSSNNVMIPMSAFNCTLPTANVGAVHTTDVNIAVSGTLTVQYTNVSFTAVWG